MTSTPPGTSTAELLQPLSADLGALVLQELQRVQEDLVGKARQAGAAARLLGASGVLGAMAIGSSAGVVMRLLDRRLPPVLSAALTAGLFAGGSAALASAAVAPMRRAWPPVPEDAVAGVREDLRAATHAVTTAPDTPPVGAARTSTAQEACWSTATATTAWRPRQGPSSS